MIQWSSSCRFLCLVDLVVWTLYTFIFLWTSFSCFLWFSSCKLKIFFSFIFYLLFLKFRLHRHQSLPLFALAFWGIGGWLHKFQVHSLCVSWKFQQCIVWTLLYENFLEGNFCFFIMILLEANIFVGKLQFEIVAGLMRGRWFLDFCWVKDRVLYFTAAKIIC